MEIWKVSRLLHYKYEVSSMGRIRRLAPGYGACVGKIRKLTIHKDGYVRLVVNQDGTKNFLVHRLVIDEFVGPRPKGMEIDHENMIRSDNRLKNLSYKTKPDNDAKGYSQSGKTSVQIVKKIRSSKERASVLAKRFGVSHQTIWSIRMRRIWRHI